MLCVLAVFVTTQAACTLLLLLGVEMGKMTVNVFSALKVLLVIFMIITGLSYFRLENVTPVAPFGFSGIMQGATSAFFGYTFLAFPLLFLYIVIIYFL
jgi:amino acid transporter